MEDHELIELAAAAAGIKYDADASKPKEGRQWWGLWKTFDREPSEYEKRYWNPLRDDGDALRLAVTCGIDIRLFGLFPYDGKRHISTLVDRLGRGFNEYPGDGDALAATRRAIVRAASELTPNA